ncbi:Short-chain dehydrogenase [Jatrophihabitans endophyticus]|uniref:Short-chain dehydrogenase n=1 Tax=Jatrophihabitans endophyticus TaxID=1206085 RepID=A0A1M5PVA7_9ACTN|nr:SDR family oxidoreductase [Jatrophihabitans endophyticus]SHH05778.1 Short-chain dehydrogenase [Jatrophihabitans endophyticus]
MAKSSALVTGASRGIGLAICRALAADGHAVTMVARNPVALAAARDEITAQGGEAYDLTANVADEADVLRIVEAHRDRFGSLDVLVNNAGMGIPSPLNGQSVKQIDLQLAVNLRAVILATQAAQPLLEKSAAATGRSLVVNVASISGKVGSAGLSVYAAAKHGIVGFTDSMNRELYASGIRFVALCPGYVDTSLSDYVKEHLAPAEMVRPEDVAESVRFLLRLSPACLVPELIFQEAAALGLRSIPLG